MSERKHSTRPPLALDLAYNPHQPRDSHGRWTRTPGSVLAKDVKKAASAIRPEAKRAFSVRPPKGRAVPSAAAQPLVAKALREVEDRAMKRVKREHEAEDVVAGAKKVLLNKRGKWKDTPEARRHFRKITHEAQVECFKEAGLHLNPKFAGKDTTALMEMWREPGHSFAERLEMREEIEKRNTQLTIVAKAMDQSMTDFVRENRRDSLRKFDAKLKTLPGGEAVIRLRERMLKDKVLDHMEGVSEAFHEHGKAYAKHVLTAVAIASLLHPLGIVAVGGAAGAGLLPDTATEAFSSLMENMWVHSGLAVALDVPLLKFLDPVFKPFEREERARKAKKFTAKHQVRRLHV